MTSWSSRKKELIFFTFILSEGHFFNIWILSQLIMYWINFQNIHTFTYQKYYFIHFCCLSLKSSKALSVSLRKAKKQHFRKLASKGTMTNKEFWNTAKPFLIIKSAQENFPFLLPSTWFWFLLYKHCLKYFPDNSLKATKSLIRHWLTVKW